MSEDRIESTQVMPAGDRTLVAGDAPPPTEGAARTQMGATVACAVCGTGNSALETYCAECGFLLASSPGAAEPAPPEETAAPELVEAGSGRRFRLRGGVTTVGREGTDILLLDGTVSRRHAQILRDNGQVTVIDLGSTNGTQVDGARIQPNQPVALAPGAVVRFGNATLTLALPAAGAEATIVTGPPSDQTLAMPSAPPVPPAEAAPAPAPAGAEAQPEDAGGVAQEEAPVARLKATSGPLPDIPIRPGTMTIGRRPGCTVVLSGDPYISGRHLQIDADISGCHLTDLGSTNGTVLNGQRLEPGQRQLLLDGDEIQVGQGTYVFETLEPPEEEEAPAAEPDPAEEDLV